MSIDWKSLYNRHASSLRISRQIKCSSYKSSLRSFADTDKIILNFCGKAKEVGWLKHCEKDVVEITREPELEVKSEDVTLSQFHDKI